MAGAAGLAQEAATLGGPTASLFGSNPGSAASNVTSSVPPNPGGSLHSLLPTVSAAASTIALTHHA